MLFESLESCASKSMVNVIALFRICMKNVHSLCMEVVKWVHTSLIHNNNVIRVKYVTEGEVDNINMASRYGREYVSEISNFFLLFSARKKKKFTFFTVIVRLWSTSNLISTLTK